MKNKIMLIVLLAVTALIATLSITGKIDLNTWITWIGENKTSAAMIALGIIEIIFYMIPTSVNVSFLVLAQKILTLFVDNRAADKTEKNSIFKLKSKKEIK